MATRRIELYEDNVKGGLVTSTGKSPSQDVYVVDATYTDLDAIGANPTAKLYSDGTIVGSTDNGSYVKYPNGELDFVGFPPAQNLASGVVTQLAYIAPCSTVEIKSIYTYMRNNNINNNYYITSVGATAGGVYPRGIASSTANYSLVVTVKGRWK